MKMRLQQNGSVGYEACTVTSTAKGGCPQQRTADNPSVSRSSSTTKSRKASMMPLPVACASLRTVKPS